MAGRGFSQSQFIQPGARWMDDRGRPIQAHGGGVIQLGGTFYWFGEDRSRENEPTKRYVSCYSSRDLTQWRFCNQVLVLTNVENLQHGWVLERPKVFYNPVTKKYVMYFHLDGALAGESGGYKFARLGVATCDSVDGNYAYLKSFRPLGHESRDIGQFIDDDGTPYLISEDRPNGFHIYKLSDDYLSVARDVCLIPRHFEGGAIVHYSGLYYFIGSHLTGWNPNPNQYAEAKSLAGPWSDFKDIAPESNDTFGSQSTMLLKVAGSRSTAVIFMADIWKPRAQWDSRYLWMPLEMGVGKLYLPPPHPWLIDINSGVTKTLSP